MTVLLVGITVAATSGLAETDTPRPLVRPGPAPQATLLFLGNLAGEIDTCSCGGDYGGLARWVGYDRLAADAFPATPRVWLDGGGMFHGGSEISDLRMQGLLDGYRRIDLKVAQLSEREIYQGLRAFLSWQEKISVPLVSTNIFRRSTGEPLVSPYQIVEVPYSGQSGTVGGTLRIAILGLNQVKTWPAYSMHAAQFDIRDPAEAAASALEQLEGQADYVVVLAWMRLDKAIDLARSVEGIDLILGSWGGFSRNKIIEGNNKVDDTRLFWVRSQGVDLAEIRLFVESSDSGISVRPEIRRVFLTERYPFDPDALDLVERVNAEAELLAGESVHPQGAATTDPPPPATKK